MNFERSNLDTHEQNIFRMRITQEALMEEASNPKFQGIVRQYFKNAQELAVLVDNGFSSLLSGDDLIEYAGRMKFCLQQLDVLRKNVEMANRGGDINPVDCLAAIAYLEGELKGLRYSLEHMAPDRIP